MIRLSSIFDHGVILRVELDRKSTRLNSSHANISYAVFCLKKKNQKYQRATAITRQCVYGAASSRALSSRVLSRSRGLDAVRPRCARAPRCLVFFFNDTATPEIYPLSLHDALPIYQAAAKEDNPYLNFLGALGLEQLKTKAVGDRKSTRLNSSHTVISYAVFCL